MVYMKPTNNRPICEMRLESALRWSGTVHIFLSYPHHIEIRPTLQKNGASDAFEYGTSQRQGARILIQHRVLHHTTALHPGRPWTPLLDGVGAFADGGGVAGLAACSGCRAHEPYRLRRDSTMPLVRLRPGCGSQWLRTSLLLVCVISTLADPLEPSPVISRTGGNGQLSWAGDGRNLDTNAPWYFVLFTSHDLRFGLHLPLQRACGTGCCTWTST